jgi:hypothetical protein
MKRTWILVQYGLLFGLMLFAGIFAYRWWTHYQDKVEVLQQVVQRLSADSRVAEVLVTGVNYDEEAQKTFTTIKFVEYDVDGRPLPAKYFTFSGNVIQFQSLVIRFDDLHIQQGDPLKGKSAYIFWKVFMLDGENTQEYDITSINAVPSGYKLKGRDSVYEHQIWQRFWDLALNADDAEAYGIKNAQIEAPGTLFIPGYLYTIRIEHDGGLRIDSERLPAILQGETILK